MLSHWLQSDGIVIKLITRLGVIVQESIRLTLKLGSRTEIDSGQT